MAVESPIVLRLSQEDRPRPGDGVQCCGAIVLVTEVWEGTGPGDWIVNAATARSCATAE